MNFQDLVTSAQKYFPKLQVKYKDQTWFMKFLGTLMFFNKGFMTDYTTTIGDTVYFPSEKFVKLHPVSSAIILMHELVHLNDQKKISKPLFGLSYLLPQILTPICLLMLFFVTWKVMVPLAVLFAAPVPAFFRMHWEKRAYLSSFYVMRMLGNRLNFDPNLEAREVNFLKNFHDSSYYFMWPFHDINARFDRALQLAKSGKRPFEDPVFDMLEDLVSKV